MWGYFIMALICISLVISDIQHLFMCLFTMSTGLFVHSFGFLHRKASHKWIREIYIYFSRLDACLPSSSLPPFLPALLHWPDLQNNGVERLSCFWSEGRRNKSFIIKYDVTVYLLLGCSLLHLLCQEIFIYLFNIKNECWILSKLLLHLLEWSCNFSVLLC